MKTLDHIRTHYWVCNHIWLYVDPHRQPSAVCQSVSDSQRPGCEWVPSWAGRSFRHLRLWELQSWTGKLSRYGICIKKTCWMSIMIKTVWNTYCTIPLLQSYITLGCGLCHVITVMQINMLHLKVSDPSSPSQQILISNFSFSECLFPSSVVWFE